MTLDKLNAMFKGLPERERRALVILALVLAVAAVVQIAWSAHEATARLRVQLPILENKLALVRQAEKSVQDNRARPPVRMYEGDALLQRAVELAKPRITTLQAGALTQDGARGIGFHATVSFDAWVDFVAAVHRELALRLVSCEVAPSSGGQVQVRAKFALADAMP